MWDGVEEKSSGMEETKFVIREEANPYQEHPIDIPIYAMSRFRILKLLDRKGCKEETNNNKNHTWSSGVYADWIKMKDA